MAQIIPEIKSIVGNPDLVRKRRRQITETAIELFGSRGFHVTTIRDIADAAKVSIGLIYQYVKDKDDILFLALAEVINSYARDIPKALEGVTDPLERFKAAFGAFCRVIDDNYAAAVLGYRESKSLPPDRLAIIKKGELATNEMLAAPIRECVEAGVFRDIDVELFTYTCVCLAHSWALNSWRFAPRRSIDAYIDGLLEIMLAPVLAAEGVEAIKRKPARNGGHAATKAV